MGFVFIAFWACTLSDEMGTATLEADFRLSPGNGRRNRRNGRLFFTGPTRLHRPYTILLASMVLF
jgi:hypothetical protein